MIRRLAHASYVTDDLPRFVKFYNETLGMPIKFSFRNADGEVFGHYLDCGDTTFIEVFDRVLKHKQWGGELRPLSFGNQYTHICLEVSDLDEFRRRLIAKGVQFGPIWDGMDGARNSWFNDPDGNPIELMEYKTDSLQVRRGYEKL